MRDFDRRAVVRGRKRLAWAHEEAASRVGTPHPRAASGLSWVGSGALLVMAQDDVAALARFDLASGHASPILLPAVGGTRRFDPGHGDKRDKPDLECVVAFGGADGVERLWAFGSGSTPRRERLAVVADPASAQDGALVPASGLYAALREAIGDRGGEVGSLNVEGAVVRGDELVLFHRGNGEGVRGPTTLHLRVADLARHLEGGPAPALTAVRPHMLGAVDGVPLGFTDAALARDLSLWWIAAAERSPDTYRDGEVLGSAIGRLDGPWTWLVEADGAPFRGKAEGLAMVDGGAWIAVDPDDPGLPTELLEVSLEGAW